MAILIFVIVLIIFRIYLENVENSFWTQVILNIIIFITLTIYAGGIKELWQGFVR